jgi:Leucine Rich repeat
MHVAQQTDRLLQLVQNAASDSCCCCHRMPQIPHSPQQFAPLVRQPLQTCLDNSGHVDSALSESLAYMPTRGHSSHVINCEHSARLIKQHEPDAPVPPPLVHAQSCACGTLASIAGAAAVPAIAAALGLHMGRSKCCKCSYCFRSSSGSCATVNASAGGDVGTLTTLQKVFDSAVLLWASQTGELPASQLECSGSVLDASAGAPCACCTRPATPGRYGRRPAVAMATQQLCTAAAGNSSRGQSDASLGVIGARAPQRARLALRGITLTPAAVRALGALLYTAQHINKLSLQHAHLCDRGAAALVDALLVNSSVEELDLASNAIGGLGARALAHLLHARAGGALGTLRVLRLDGNCLGVDGHLCSHARFCPGSSGGPPITLALRSGHCVM